MSDEKILNKIYEQNILISGIANMSGDHALSLNHNFRLKQILYALPDKEDNWVNYVMLNNFTTFCQLISFLTSNYVIELKSYDLDGFTMLITISKQTK